MIDKKPFRVTNEQVKNLATCKNQSCTGCASHGLCEMATNGNWEKPVEMLSLDLLDARELIDKQEALIKKQSIMLQTVEKDLNWMLNEGKLLAPHAFKYFYDGIKELEKTKDYA